MQRVLPCLPNQTTVRRYFRSGKHGNLAIADTVAANDRVPNISRWAFTNHMKDPHCSNIKMKQQTDIHINLLFLHWNC